MGMESRTTATTEGRNGTMNDTIRISKIDAAGITGHLGYELVWDNQWADVWSEDERHDFPSNLKIGGSYLDGRPAEIKTLLSYASEALWQLEKSDDIYEYFCDVPVNLQESTIRRAVEAGNRRIAKVENLLRRKLDEITKATTAWRTFAELVEMGRDRYKRGQKDGGFIPTLRVGLHPQAAALKDAFDYAIRGGAYGDKSGAHCY